MSVSRNKAGPKAMTFRRRADRLWEIFTTSAEAAKLGSAEASEARKKRVFEFLDVLEQRRRLEFSRPSEASSRDELVEVAIARVLEKRGHSTKEISELLPVWRERFAHLERQFAEAREAREPGTDTGRFGR
jgi:hypothetical protein